MDSSKFDLITRKISEVASRRSIVRNIVGGGTATALVGFSVLHDADAKKKKKKKHQCKKDKDCKKPSDPCEVAVCKAHKCKKEKLALCITTVTPNKMGPWQFFNDQDDQPIDPTMESGPEEPPQGAGSAVLQIGGNSEGKLLSARIFRGTPIADFETLEYATFVTASGGTAPSLQLGIDRNDDDPVANELYQGRLVFVPSASASQDVEIGDWQTWDVLDSDHGAAWGVTKDFNHPDDTTCRLGVNACTLQQVLAAFPGIRINTIGPSPDNDGAGWGIIGFKVGSGEGAVDANVDALSIKVSGDSTTTVFDFEPNA